MKKMKPSPLESLKQSLAKADATLNTAKATSASLTQTLVKTPSAPAATADPLPSVPEVQRVDNSPYRKESRK